jgi:hypothetical protein
LAEQNLKARCHCKDAIPQAFDGETTNQDVTYAASNANHTSEPNLILESCSHVKCHPCDAIVLTHEEVVPEEARQWVSDIYSDVIVITPSVCFPQFDSNHLDSSLTQQEGCLPLNVAPDCGLRVNSSGTLPSSNHVLGSSGLQASDGLGCSTPAQANISLVAMDPGTLEKGRNLHEVLQLFKQSTTTPLSSSILQTPKHKNKITSSHTPGGSKETPRKSPRLQAKNSSEKSMVKLAQDPIAKKCGIIEEKENLDAMTLP